MEVYGNSMLAIQQIAGECTCESESLRPYCARAKELQEAFDDVLLEYAERERNQEANDLAK